MTDSASSLPDPRAERRERAAAPVTRRTFLIVTVSLGVAVLALAAALLAVVLVSRPGTEYRTEQGNERLNSHGLHVARQAAERDSGTSCYIPGTTSPYLSADGNHIVELAPYAFCGSGGAARVYDYVVKSDPNVSAGESDLATPRDGAGLYAQYAQGHQHFRP